MTRHVNIVLNRAEAGNVLDLLYSNNKGIVCNIL
jgi:hypothetical protein